MSDVKWTEEQKQAINEKDSNILVAAAAGSGKTAVLVERIINKVINRKIDIDKILVVTFTSAAASEIRERILEAIYKKLEENSEDTNLQKQINLINKANISTIHSFCLDVIRNNFYELDISSNFRVADTTEVELMKYEVLEELFEEKYLNNDKDFEDLINIYTDYRGDEELQNLILSIYKFIQSNPFPEKWINEKVDLFKNQSKDFAQTIWGKIILQNIEEEITEGIMQLKNILKDLKKFDELNKFTRIIQEDIYNLEDILKYTNSWDNTLIKINNLVWQKWPIDKKVTVDLKERAKEVRNKVKETLNKSIKKKMAYDSTQANEDINEMNITLTKLKNVLLEFMLRFSNKKREKNVVDFNDIEHLALKLLINENGEATEVAKKYKEKFDEIAIDEYQDSNLVQEQILTSISKGNNIFMVGDVKQSIYKFRQARPELFLEKYKKYNLKQEFSGSSLGLKIQLFENFRSRENILNITNLLFQNIMSEKVGDIEYNEKEYLNYSAGYREPEENTNYAGKTELHIIDLKEKGEIYINEEETEEKEEVEKIENTVLEAKFVANKINELLNSNYMVFDKKQGYRKITYKDIVILLRATTNIAPIYEKELTDINLPVFSDSSSQYLDTMEIQIIVSILKIINNPIQDIPLVTVLRSPIFAFTDNDLISIRLTDKNCSFYESMMKVRLIAEEQLSKKINNVIYYLKKWQEEEKYLPLDELIWQIYIDTNFLNIVGLMPNGAIRQANLKMLFEKAKQFENASFKGLFNFINFIDRLKNNNGDLSSAKLIGENENVIRIMSIHKSKGLEFPVVFICGTGKGFNMRDLNQSILLHQELGIGPKLIDFERRIEYDTLAKEAIKLKIKLETLSEEQRILYVALTRAREKLIITGINKDLEKDFKQKRELLQIYNENTNIIDYKLVKKYKTYLDWLELVYLKNEDTIKNIATLYIHSKEDLEKEFNNKEQEDSINIKERILENTEKLKDIENIDKILNWEYKYKKSSQIPTKTSVTKLKMEENVKIKLTEVPKFIGKGKNNITSAEKGTLMHLCIQKLNEKQLYTRETIEQMIKSLVSKEIITIAEAETINIESLYKYTKSDLWNNLSKAKEIHKEQPFYINIPAKEIHKDIETDENILVQGIIDLYYISEDNKLILVDYKTDYVKKIEELINKYKTQLLIYKTALEKSLNRRVDETYIFSTNLEQLLIVPIE